MVGRKTKNKASEDNFLEIIEEDMGKAQLLCSQQVHSRNHHRRSAHLKVRG